MGEAFMVLPDGHIVLQMPCRLEWAGSCSLNNSQAGNKEIFCTDKRVAKTIIKLNKTQKYMGKMTTPTQQHYSGTRNLIEVQSKEN